MADIVIFCGYDSELPSKPAGAYLIANIFRKCGYNAIVINHLLRLSKEQIKKLIDKFVNDKTKIIALSTTLLAVNDNPDNIFKWIFDECKSIASDARFIIGGSSVNSGFRSTLPFNYGIIGQAEGTILALLRHIEYEENIIFSEITNNVKYISDKVYSFDNYNTNDYSKYSNFDAIRHNETLAIEYARGCVFKCDFCAFDLLGKNFGDYTKTEENMYSILMHNYEKFGITRYIFTDETFNDSLEKAKSFEKIVNKLPFNLEYSCYMRIELLQKHPEMIELYQNTGLRGVKFGIETFNKKAGSTVGKGFGERAKDILEKAYSIWKDDVNITCNFIIGLPHDTIKDLERQIKWLENSPAVGNCFFNFLRIWRDEKTGFNVIPELVNYYIDQTPNDNKPIINWKSPIMDMNTAEKLAVHMVHRTAAKRKTYMKKIDAFNLIIMMERADLNMLKGNINPETDKFIFNDYFDKVPDIYFDTMMSINEQAVNKISIPIIEPHKNIFESKIHFKRK